MPTDPDEPDKIDAPQAKVVENDLPIEDAPLMMDSVTADAKDRETLTVRDDSGSSKDGD